MARWSEGYVADVAYTSNFYRDITPAWLHLACLLFGQRPPDLDRPLRYAELGCGFGLTDAVVAACHPKAEVWGFDFNPTHVEAAADLAARAGLSNLRCEERSFADLAESADLPQFDVVTLHGVYSWIAPEHRRQIVAFVRRHLRPGGLLYVSYNVTTGWASMLPVRALMRQVAASGHARSDEAVGAAARFVERLRDGGASYFAAHPSAEPRLKMLSTLDAKYLAHEYMNEHWHPQMSAEVAAELAEAKCVFIGSATLSDNIDAASVPAGLLAMLAEQTDATMRETVRDFACGQGFRRDIFRRGHGVLGPAEQLERLDALTFVSLTRKIPDEVTFAASIGQVTGKAEIYRPLLEALAAGPLTMAAARAMPVFEGKPVTDVMQALTLLTSGGYAHPLLPSGSEPGRGACRRLNAEIARANRQGAATSCLAAPAIGSAVTVELIDTLIVGELLAGRAAERGELTGAVAEALARTGRHVQADGQAITDPAASRAAVETIVAGALADRLPLFRTLGILD